jgi:two-component system NtrC family sensor kinase
MHFFAFLAALLMVRRLSTFLKFSPLRAKWVTPFTLATWLSIAIYIVTVTDINDTIKCIIWAGVLTGMVLYAYREPDFEPMRPFIKDHFPLVGAMALLCLVKLIDEVFPKADFYEKYNNFVAIAVVGAFVWILARQAATKKQQKELQLIGQQNLVLDKLVAQRTAELTKQKDELQETLKLLQTTQQQLIQSEKLASLGELTAGIAHEIQNPLNFVNNFSEVSMELIDEMEQELANGDKDEAVAIAGDIKQNLEKIIHHGRRADGIVKGMLQHSRASNGVKEPVNINTLADEYLRLAYHGLRAKDKSFNTEMVTHFDENLPMISALPQDIGRVLLNLFINAFYAVQQKQATADASYKPTVELYTESFGTSTGQKDAHGGSGWIAIRVRDNGNGVPEAIKDKIMQPFFTTKPTGQGTGLGLSLSYDIVAKGHGGTIEVNSKEGEFSEFIIKLPL